MKSVVPILIALFALNCHAASPEVKVTTAEGEEHAGTLDGFGADSVKVGGKEFAHKEIAGIKFPTAASAPGSLAPAVFLRNGDVYYQAAIVSADDNTLKMKSPAFGEIELDYKNLDRIVFYAPGKKMPDGLDAFVKGPPPKEDLLLTVKGDSVSGFFEKFSGKDISFNSNGQSRQFPFDQLAAVRLAALEKGETNAALNAIVIASNSSRVTAKLKGIEEGKVVLETLGGREWKVNAYEISSIEFSGGRLVYLSALEPAEQEQKPLVGGVPVVFTWRKDRSVAGTELKIGDTVYEKGIGVHSYCKLTYDLGGAYAKFICDAGVDASSPSGTDCAWKVLLDGKEAAGGVAKAGGAKTAVKVDATGVKRLELVCDYGPDGDDAGDRFDFGNARLVKP